MTDGQIDALIQV